MGETAAININRVQFGIAMAHKMMPGFGGHVVLNRLPTVERLIEWKSSRVDEFDKPIPEQGWFARFYFWLYILSISEKLPMTRIHLTKEHFWFFLNREPPLL